MLEGTIIAGKYRVLEKIGSGGMAEVYRGRSVDSGREVGIKMLKSEFSQQESFMRRFRVEAHIAQTYSHRNIVKTYDVCTENGILYIIMEYVNGCTLKEYIARYGRVPTEEAVRIARQICSALFYAHSHRLIHRDIKPQNILINAEGVVKVADFGIAKSDAVGTLMADTSSSALGSVHYISPEQARGDNVNEKADIYSLGVVLYEMVTGEVPFKGDTPVVVALKQLQEEPVPPRILLPSIPPALEKIILKAMSKEQSARYDNAREMARDLERVMNEPDGQYVKYRNQQQNTSMIPNIRTILSSREKTAEPETPPPTRSNDVIKAVLWTSVAAVSVLILYLGARSIATGLAQPHTIVPQAVGFPLNIAEARLDDARLDYEVMEVASDTVLQGDVIEQTPQAGEQLATGELVTLKVSSGPQSITMPSLANMSLADATRKVESAGLRVGDVRYEPSQSAQDTVTAQSPDPGENILKGSYVNLWLAQPAVPGQQAMPDLTGQTKDKAVEYLTRLGIPVERIKRIANSAPIETVIKQDPPENTPLNDDSVVTLWISNGESSDPYMVDHTIDLNIPQDGVTVSMIFEDGDFQQQVFKQYYDKAGQYEVILQLESATLGDKTLIVLFDDKEQLRENISFSVDE